MVKNYKTFIISALLFTTLPFLLFLTQINFELLDLLPEAFWYNTASIVAATAGFIGAVLLFWQFILGTRHVMKFITDDYIWLMKIHQWIGKYGVVLIFIHPLLETYAYFEGIFWSFLPNVSTDFDLHVTFGRFAYVFFIIIWVTSALLRGRMRYRPWLYFHYLSYPIMAFVLLHALTIGSFLEEYILLKGIWFGMIAMFLVIVAYRFGMYSGFLKNRYEVIQKKKVGEFVVLLKIRPKNSWILPKVGQFCYLQRKRFGESHPFSVMEFDSRTGEMTFGIRLVGSYSEKMMNMNEGDTIFVDGPYGVFTKEGQNSDPKFIIAGGIGITSLYRLVMQFGDENTYMAHANRTIEDIVNREQLMEKLGDRYVDFLDGQVAQDTPRIINHRFDMGSLQMMIGNRNPNEFRYFICGSPGFIAAMIEMCKKANINEDRIFYEKFGL